MKNQFMICVPFALSIWLGGCGAASVHGKVFSSDLGRVLLVSDTDTRMDDDGLEGVRVSLIQGGDQSRAMTVLAAGTSEADGSFTLSYSNENLRAGRILVRAESESVFKLQNLVEFPRDGEALLVQVIERKTSTESPPKDQAE